MARVRQGRGGRGIPQLTIPTQQPTTQMRGGPISSGNNNINMNRGGGGMLSGLPNLRSQNAFLSSKSGNVARPRGPISDPHKPTPPFPSAKNPVQSGLQAMRLPHAMGSTGGPTSMMTKTGTNMHAMRGPSNKNSFPPPPPPRSGGNGSGGQPRRPPMQPPSRGPSSQVHDDTPTMVSSISSGSANIGPTGNGQKPPGSTIGPGATSLPTPPPQQFSLPQNQTSSRANTNNFNRQMPAIGSLPLPNLPLPTSSSAMQQRGKSPKKSIFSCLF